MDVLIRQERSDVDDEGVTGCVAVDMPLSEM